MTVVCPDCGKDITFDPETAPVERELFPAAKASNDRRDLGRYVLTCPHCGKQRSFPVSARNGTP